MRGCKSVMGVRTQGCEGCKSVRSARVKGVQECEWYKGASQCERCKGRYEGYKGRCKGCMGVQG